MGNTSDQILYCLLGNEIKNSLSPTIHNNLLKSNNLNGLYITINVDSANLKGVINTLCKLNFRGFNVTIPHKTNILQYLDSLDPLAQEVNAVNTILHDNKKLIGYNTDVEGFMTPLHGKIKNFDNKKAVILGAGGASKAVLYGLTQANCKEIIILNRSLENAKANISKLNSDISISCDKLTQQNIDSLSDIDILINTVPLNKTNTSFIFNKKLNVKIAYDLEYIPKETNFIKQMKSINADVIYGYEMLITQAKLSFNIWTGISSNTDSLNAKILDLLGE